MIDYKDIAKRQSKKKENNRPTSSKVKTKTGEKFRIKEVNPFTKAVSVKEKKRKQQMPTTKSGFQATEPMTSRRLKQSSDKPKKTRRVADEFVRGNRKSSLNRPPVKGNVGEFKTSGETKIEKERKRKVSFPVKNKSLNTRGKRTTKIEQARKSRPDKKNKSLDTSGKRTTKIEQARKEKISLQRAGGGKVGSKFFTGGMVNPSYGTDFDDR